MFSFSNHLLSRTPYFAVGEDYMDPENASITLSMGLHGHYNLSLRLFIIGDELYEGDESLFLMLSSNDMVAVFNLSVVEVTIVDDDSGECIVLLYAISVDTALCANMIFMSFVWKFHFYS